MKRFLVILLTVLAMLALTGCCLRHDMQPASCTQPATCSKCGKTEGEPLGHTAVTDPAKEPTCTEAGLTEGTHCSVCGEVLAAQEKIPPLGHTAVTDPAKEPTCTEAGLTEGTHCSVCGVILKAQEEIPALGHTAVTDPAKEATCTETGLTEGTHCSVCGEVLAAQEKIPPLGHTWAEASFSRPKTCLVCGQTEGEAPGAAVFLDALEAGAHTAGDRAAAQTEQAAGKKPVFKTFLIRVRTSGLDELDDSLDSSSLKLTVDTREKDTLFLAGDVILRGADPIKALAAADRQGLTFTLPELSDEIWHIKAETLEEMLGTTISLDPAARDSVSAAREASGALLMRYARIILGVFTPENTEETRETYALELLGGSEECTVLRSRPDAAQWQRMLEELYTTAMNDAELEEELRKYAGMSGAYQQPEYPTAGRGNTGDELVASFRAGLQEMLGKAAYTAQILSGCSFELAERDSRVHALKLLDGEALLAGYESAGALDDERTDILTVKAGVPGGITLKNSMRKSGDTTNGFMSLDAVGLTLSYQFGKTADGQPVFDVRLNAMGQIIASSLRREAENAHLTAEYSSVFGGASLDVLSADGEEEIVIPDGKLTEITTQEQLQKVMDDIGLRIENALRPEPAGRTAAR